MTRTPLVVGNWKMNTTRDEARALVQSLLPALAGVSGVEVVVLPPFPWLTDVAALLEGSGIGVGAQTMHTETGGAYTGEVSPRMLSGLCQYVLVGQYERRILSGEKDAIVRRKLQVAQQHHLRAILCVGENADQLDEGLGPYVVADQLEAALEDTALSTTDLVVAYDPAWTTMGLVAPPPVDYAGEIIAHIRQTLTDLLSPTAAAEIRIIYGGPANPRNITEIVALPEGDGVLAGTSSINAANFTNLIKAFAR